MALVAIFALLMGFFITSSVGCPAGDDDDDSAVANDDDSAE